MDVHYHNACILRISILTYRIGRLSLITSLCKKWTSFHSIVKLFFIISWAKQYFSYPGLISISEAIDESIVSIPLIVCTIDMYRKLYWIVPIVADCFLLFFSTICIFFLQNVEFQFRCRPKQTDPTNMCRQYEIAAKASLNKKVPPRSRQHTTVCKRTSNGKNQSANFKIPLPCFKYPLYHMTSTIWRLNLSPLPFALWISLPILLRNFTGTRIWAVNDLPPKKTRKNQPTNLYYICMI